MRILRLLSEEVFDFARVDLTQAKTKVRGVWWLMDGGSLEGSLEDIRIGGVSGG